MTSWINDWNKKRRKSSEPLLQNCSSDEEEPRIVFFKTDVEHESDISEQNAIHVNLSLAIREVKQMPIGMRNTIGFRNRVTGELIKINKISKNKWLINTGIPEKRVYETGYTFMASASYTQIFTILGLFFGDEPWFDLLNWKFVRLGRLSEVLP